MSATYPCPICHKQVPTRLSPSRVTRLARHNSPLTSVSCLGTGWEVSQ